MTDARHVDVEIRWRASSLTRALATGAAVALAAAVMGSRWQLITFVAPMLGVLCSIGWQPLMSKVQVHAQPGLQRCFEDENATLSIWATTESGQAAVDLVASADAGMRLEACNDSTYPRTTIEVQAQRWGRYPIGAQLDVLAAGGLLIGTATVEAAEINVFPFAPPQATALPCTELPDRLGTHLTRHIGAGVEYADIRPYSPGDELRTVNWPVSARRGRLHVTQRLTDRAADVVVLIDTYPQPPGPATQATERTARGAVQVVQTALRHGDRAGIAALGSRHARWLGANTGRPQFYRILDTVLGAGDVFQSTTGTLAPRAAVPPGAIVVAFSTLLDTEFALALIDLRQRGHHVVAVDVLDECPLEGQNDPLVNRLWALQRSAMHRDMATIGVDVVSWRADSTLDQSLRPIPGHRPRLRARR